MAVALPARIDGTGRERDSRFEPGHSMVGEQPNRVAKELEPAGETELRETGSVADLHAEDALPIAVLGPDAREHCGLREALPSAVGAICATGPVGPAEIFHAHNAGTTPMNGTDPDKILISLTLPLGDYFVSSKVKAQATSGIWSTFALSTIQTAR